MGVFYIYFLGGEPFMREDFLDILDFCNHLKLGIMISTNGWFVDKHIARRVAKAKTSLIRVSIDGATNKTHDHIRRKKGSFKKAWEALENLRAVDIPIVGISVTVMEDNFQEIENLIELAISEKIAELQLVQLCSTGRGIKAKKLSLEHWKELRKILLAKEPEYQKYLRFSSTEGLLEKPNTKQFRTDSNYTPIMMGCTAGRATVAISADGKVMPCIQFRKIAGDLRQNKFKDIWLNSPILEERRIIKKECEPCKFSKICTKECPIDSVPNLEEYRCAFAKINCVN